VRHRPPGLLLGMDLEERGLRGMIEASNTLEGFKRKVDVKIPKINSTGMMDLDV